MNHRILVPPVVEPLTLDEVKVYLRVDSNHEDALLDGLIKTARCMIEDYTGLALITQTCRVWVGVYEKYQDWVNLPKAPFQDLILPPMILQGGLSTRIQGYRIDRSRPQARLFFSSFMDTELTMEIDYRCGYGDAPESVPDPLRQAMLLLIADLYENRPGEKPSEILPGMVRALISPYRVIRLC